MKAPTPKRLPREITSDNVYTRGLLHGRKWALEDAAQHPTELNDAWHRGHSAGMYAAAALLAGHLGVDL
jgi:hypothetical protein